MMIVVTGAAGFIGSNLVKALNERGETDIVAVDNLEQADKFRNLVDCEVSDFVDKGEFLERVQRGNFPRPAVVFHLGARSDTMATDGRFMMENNFRYSTHVLNWCQQVDALTRAEQFNRENVTEILQHALQAAGTAHAHGDIVFLIA